MKNNNAALKETYFKHLFQHSSDIKVQRYPLTREKKIKK